MLLVVVSRVRRARSRVTRGASYYTTMIWGEREIYLYFRYITGRYISPGPLPYQDAFGASWRMVFNTLASFRTHRAAAARTPPPQPCAAEVAFVALAATDICAMLGFLVAFLWLLYRTGVRLRRMDYGATRYHQVSEFEFRLMTCVRESGMPRRIRIGCLATHSASSPLFARPAPFVPTSSRTSSS